MAAPRVDNDKAAMILVEALFFGHKQAAKKNGVSVKTVSNYQIRLRTDSDLATNFRYKKDLFIQGWADKIPIAIQAGIDFLTRAFIELEPTPENVHAVAGAMKLLADIGLTKEMFDARFGKVIASERESMGQMAITNTASSPE